MPVEIYKIVKYAASVCRKKNILNKCMLKCKAKWKAKRIVH